MDIVAFLDDLGMKSPKEIKFFHKIFKWAMNASKSFIAVLFTQLMMQIITPYYKKIESGVNNVAGKFKKLLNAIRFLVKIFKAIITSALKVIKIIVQLYLNFANPACWVTWGVTLVLIILIFFSMLFGKFGTFQGEIVIDFEKMREMNQDESQYTDLLNQAALRESFYQSVASTSFYQTFNLTDMDGGKVDLSALIVSKIHEFFSNTSFSIEDFFAEKKCIGPGLVSCIYARGNVNSMASQAGISIPQTDRRYALTDANKNPAKYLIQSESLGTYTESFGLTSYFRDYWNRESRFSLSSDFLYELNRWIYETDSQPTTEQIVYPEAFVQPVSYVYDYLRIQNDTTMDGFGKPYVYVTQRVSLEDIQDPTNEFYDKYEYEGLIKTLPSDIVYDYAVAGLNLYEIAKDTASADEINLGNPSKYATEIKKIEYEDGTEDYTKEVMRLYWIVNPYYIDKHMAEEVTEDNFDSISKQLDEIDGTFWKPTDDKIYGESYITTNYKLSSGENITGAAIEPYWGPFVGLHTGGDGQIYFDQKLSYASDEDVKPAKNSIVYHYKPKSDEGNYHAFVVIDHDTYTSIEFVTEVIDYYKTLANATKGNSLTISKGSFVYAEGEYYECIETVKLDSISISFEDVISNFRKVQSFITYENNKYPTKHYQLSQLTDEEGNIIVSSRNLVNKMYLKRKAIRPSYRHSDEYWDNLEVFMENDLEKVGYQGYFSDLVEASFLEPVCTYKEVDDEDGPNYKRLHYCPSGKESCEPDGEVWDEKKCSIISYVNQKYPLRDIDAKIQNWIFGEDGSMDAPAEAIYMILVEYEDYLMETGTQGVQWEYKYHTYSNAQAEQAKAQFQEVSTLFGWKFKDYSGISTYFETDTERYKKTFDAVVELNESRAIASEYTPVAIITSDTAEAPPTGVTLNQGISWGWRIAKEGDEYVVKIAYGETSYEFPDYYNAKQIEENVITQKFYELLNGITEEGTILNKLGNGLIDMLFNTDYGEVIYGSVNFAYKWEGDDLIYDSESLKNFYMSTFLHAQEEIKHLDMEESADDETYQDIRNQDQAWNPDVVVYRPEPNDEDDGATATMVSCVTKNKDGSDNMTQCGRITSKYDPEDYYALELKSVRDYGLASILSYVEARKVTFMSGLAVTETYDIEGVQRWLQKYYEEELGFNKIAAWDQSIVSASGFFPQELLDDSITVEIDGKQRPLSYYTHSTKLYDTDKSWDLFNTSSQPSSLGEELDVADLVAISDGLNDLQNTGRSIFEYEKNGVTYWFTVSYVMDANDSNTDADRGFVLMMKKYPYAKESEWIRTNINVVIPYITGNVFEDIFAGFGDFWVGAFDFKPGMYTDKMAKNEASNQFFNPLAYYLAWYDYSIGDIEAKDSVINFVTGQGLIDKYDNYTAEKLRVLFNRAAIGIDPIDGDFTLEDISNVKTKFWASNSLLEWFAETFNIGDMFRGAGRYTTDSIWDKFYEETHQYATAIDLLDLSRSSRVYMIEEAITFVGNFVYTYDTELLIAGDLNGNDRIVADLIFSDRYYAINNYIFSVPVYPSDLEWSDNMTMDFVIENYHPEIYGDTYYEDIIAANNPCATYHDNKEYDEDNHPIKNIFVKIKDSFVDLLYTINGKLNLFDWESSAMGEWVVESYCTSNYSYKSEYVPETHSVTQTLVYPTKLQQVETTYGFCINHDGTEGGTRAGKNRYGCTEISFGTYVSYVDVYKSVTVERNGLNASDAGAAELSKEGVFIDQSNPYFKPLYNDSGELVKTIFSYGSKSKQTSKEAYNLYYQWSFKYGYVTKSGQIDDDRMIHIDTYNELLLVYKDLLNKGYSDTAAKIFIGLQIYDSIDSIAWFNAKTNRIDFKKGTSHNITQAVLAGEESEYRNIINYDTLDQYETWCIRVEGDTKCEQAAYGDADSHYTTYNNGMFITDDDTALFDKISAVFSNAFGWITKKDDLKTNLQGRYGFLMGADRLNSNGSLKANVEDWVVLDKYGAIDSNLTSDTDLQHLKISEDNFELTEDDLARIAQSIYDVFSENYSASTFKSLGQNATDAAVVELFKTNSDWEWNKILHGTEVNEGSGVENLVVSGDSCTVAYYWLSNNAGVDESQVTNKVMCESILNGEGKYHANDFMYGHQILFEHAIANDWRLVFTGIEIADYQNFGIPQALYTRIYGSRRQIGPVETEMFFNEEVYDSWIKRVEIGGAMTSEKEEFVLRYFSAKQNYLYEYLTNFETYVPLGVLSDADLVTRGADDYKSIASNSNRSFSYTSTYTSIIKEYLDTPGWVDVIDNYHQKTSGLSAWFESFNPTVNNRTTITKDAMVQYIAGLIETTVQYAPTWTIEYHIQNNTDNYGTQIAKDVDNYNAISEALYASLFATNSNDISSRTVKLHLEDGSYHEFPMLYLGYGAIFAQNMEEPISSGNVANDVPGFLEEEIIISDDQDDRLDLASSLAYVSSKFGRLLYKYGNVSSATMAYFYGEDYWDQMLLTARTQGISTGPEWHNDDVELILEAIDQIEETSDRTNGIFPVLAYSEDVVTNVYTAQVVDHVLSYILDPAVRLYLIRNTTSQLGKEIASIGSLAEKTKAMYEELTNGGVIVYTGDPDDEGGEYDQLYSIKFEGLNDLTRKLELDLGVLMAVIMSASDGNPCAGLGSCSVVGGEYIMSHLRLNDKNRVGLLGLVQGENITMKYNKTAIDYKENCLPDSDYTWVKTNYDTANKMCTVRVNDSLYVPKMSSIDTGGWWTSESIVKTVNFTKEVDDAILESVEKYFESSAFANGSKKAILALAIQLSNLYREHNENALETVFVYFNGEEALIDVKSTAISKGFGTNWYGYYVENRADSEDMVVRTLNYYDATMETTNNLVFETVDNAAYVDSNLSGKVIFDTFFDEEYKRVVTETKTYENCTKTTVGTCERTFSVSGAVDTTSSYCSRYSIGDVVDTIPDGAEFSNIKFNETYTKGYVQYTYTYKDVDAEDCGSIVNGIESALNKSAGNMKSSTFDKSKYCKASDQKTTTQFSVTLDIGDQIVNIPEREVLNIGIVIIDPAESNSINNAWQYYWEGKFLNKHKVYYLEDVVKDQIKRTCFVANYPNYKSMNGTDLLEAYSEFAGVTYDSDNQKVYCNINVDMSKSGNQAASEEDLKKSFSKSLNLISENSWNHATYVNSSNKVIWSLNSDHISDVTAISSRSAYPAINIKFNNTGEYLISNNESTQSYKDILNLSITPDSSTLNINGKTEYGACVYEYTYKEIESGTEDRLCVANTSHNGKYVQGAVFVYDDVAPELGLFHCTLKTKKEIHYKHSWKLSINGFSVSAFALFGDASSFNEYVEDKVAMQNSGMEVYVKETSNTRDYVDIIITSTFATEDNFKLNAMDYSIFAFFQTYDDYAGQNVRSWISSFDDLVEEGSGTTNQVSYNETWDFPVLAKLNHPLKGGGEIRLVERFGNEDDLINGGSKMNEGLTIRAKRGTKVLNMIEGTVASTGYNPLYGNYVEVHAKLSGLGSDIISSTLGERYQITGFRIIYGYLLSEEYDGYIPEVGDVLKQGDQIGIVGHSGRSTGNQLYIAIYVECNLLDGADEVVKEIYWSPVDPEKYFTTKWADHSFNVVDP